MSIANLLKKNDYNIFSDKILQLNPNVVVRKSTTEKLLRNNETTIIKVYVGRASWHKCPSQLPPTHTTLK